MADADLKTILEAAQVGFGVVEGPDMTFTVANARYLQMVSRTDIVGRRWVDAFPELVDTPTHEALRAAYRGDRIAVQEFPMRLVRDGELRDCFYSFSLDPFLHADRSVAGFVVIAVDVTELVSRRHEAERLAKKLQDSEARYRSLFGAMDDGFCLVEMIVDATGSAVDYRFLEANVAFERHTGLVDPVGKTARELVPGLDESWFRLYGAVAETGEPARFENNAPAMGRWFDVFASRVGDPSLRQVGLVFKDVSARKRVELEKEALLASEQAARRDAEAANATKNQFLATVSHELRTPLNAVLGWVTMLRGGRVGADKVGRALETIERNARAQAQLIEDLLDVSRILEGKLRLDVQVAELASVIQAAIETIRPAAEAKDLRLQPALASGATVMGDPHRLQQIVWNLLSNAVKFTPKGGRVQVLLELVDSSAVVTVSDTGAGIPREFQPHVFERFRQADGGTTRQHGGLGLGLSIVRHLAEMHGGSVSVFSEGRGKGASFTVRLPRALARRPAALAPEGQLAQTLRDRGFPCPPELEGLHVLAVDDEEDARDVLRSLLETCKLRVTLAGSVAEAFQRFQAERPSLVLSDIGMPGENGFDLIKLIRALPAAAGGDVPAIAITAYARSEDRTQCLLAGFSSHVPKPVEPMELLAVIASLARRERGSSRD